MKKVLALALALIMVFSMGTMAFADSTTTTTAAKADEPVKMCPICENEFVDPDAYNDHIAICKEVEEGGVVSNISIQEIIAAMLELIKSVPALDFSLIETIIVRLVDFIEKIGTAAVSEADVKGAVADLEAALAGFEIPGMSDLLNSLKQQIKNLYAGEVATTVEVTTEVAPPAETGSSSVGIAVFAAVSVAAAAAYVCTKKSK